MESSWVPYNDRAVMHQAAADSANSGTAFDTLKTQHKRTEAWIAVKLFADLYPPEAVERHIRAYGAVYFMCPSFFDAAHIGHAADFLQEALALFRVEIFGIVDGHQVIKIFL